MTIQDKYDIAFVLKHGYFFMNDLFYVTLRALNEALIQRSFRSQYHVVVVLNTVEAVARLRYREPLPITLYINT